MLRNVTANKKKENKEKETDKIFSFAYICSVDVYFLTNVAIANICVSVHFSDHQIANQAMAFQ